MGGGQFRSTPGFEGCAAGTGSADADMTSVLSGELLGSLVLPFCAPAAEAAGCGDLGEASRGGVPGFSTEEVAISATCSSCRPVSCWSVCDNPAAKPLMLCWGAASAGSTPLPCSGSLASCEGNSAAELASEASCVSSCPPGMPAGLLLCASALSASPCGSESPWSTLSSISPSQPSVSPSATALQRKAWYWIGC